MCVRESERVKETDTFIKTAAQMNFRAKAIKG